MTGPSFHYRLWGLGVVSDFPMAEVPDAANAASDVAIRRRAVPDIAGDDAEFRAFRILEDGDLLSYRGVGRFLVASGSEVFVDLDPAFDPRLIGLPLLGPVFALLLHRRGQLVLHGSAVEIAGKAHVFLGDKGTGKSTTALALIAAGHRLIADDVVALELASDGSVGVCAGCPAMKLDRAMLTDLQNGTYTVIQPDEGAYTSGKSRVRLGPSLRAGAAPLGGLHCLERGTENRLSAIKAAETLRTLLRFSHYPRNGGDAVRADQTAALFRQATAFAPHVAADVLTVKNALDELPALASFLARETSALACA